MVGIGAHETDGISGAGKDIVIARFQGFEELAADAERVRDIHQIGAQRLALLAEILAGSPGAADRIRFNVPAGRLFRHFRLSAGASGKSRSQGRRGAHPHHDSAKPALVLAN